MKNFTKFYLGALLLFSAIVTAQAVAQYNETPATAKLKYNGAIQPTVYDSVDAARIEARRLVDSGVVRVDIDPTVITVTKSSTAAASSRAASSVATSSASSVSVARLIKPTSITASTYTGSNKAPLAIDGDPATRWESLWGTNTQTLRLDLGSSYALGNLAIDWEDSNAETYKLDGSTDAATWVTLVTFTGGSFGARTDSLDLRGTYRYLRLTFTKRPAVSQWGYSIYELRVMTAGASTSSSAPESSAASSAASSVARVPLAIKDVNKLNFCQPTQRLDKTSLPLSEISHYTAVRFPPGEAGQAVRLEKDTTPCITVPIPFTVYQGDAVRLFTYDTAGLMSDASTDAAAGGLQ